MSLTIPEQSKDNNQIETTQLLPPFVFEAVSEPSSIQTSKVTPEFQHDVPHIRFGSVRLFSPWFPEADPDNKRNLTFMKRLSHRESVLIIHRILASAVLLFNVIITIYFAARHQSTSDFYTGDCARTREYNSVIHIFINVISTILLGSSNYCAQLLAAPTRPEVDKAHSKHDWLDIGIPSYRNLRNSRIAVKRRIAWYLLMFTSILLHLVWNSAIFAATPFSTYNVLAVTSDYQSQLPSPIATPESLQILSPISTYQRLNRSECIDVYLNSSTNAGLHNLVLVAENITTNDSLSLVDPTSSILFELIRSNRTFDRIADDWAFAVTWACTAFVEPNNYGPWSWCTASFLKERVDAWTIYRYTLGEQDHPVRELWMKVDYCLSGGSDTFEDRCSLRYDLVIMILVCILNFGKTVVIFYTGYIQSYHIHEKEVLVTTGDAVASFLRSPANETISLPFATSADFRGKTWPTTTTPPSSTPVRWYRAPERHQWVVGFIAAAILIIVVAILYIFGTRSLREHGQTTDVRSLYRDGLAKIQPYAVVLRAVWRSMPQRAGFYSAIIFANMWQVIVSGVYLLINNLITTMLVANEWNGFIHERKTLRVSNPHGIQRSSYFLSLPLRFALPLSIVSSILHWFISQSVFVIQMVGYRLDLSNKFEPFSQLDNSVVGFSAFGIFCCLITGIVLLIATASIGFLGQYRPRPIAAGETIDQSYAMPLAGTCSAAISAACHRVDDDCDASLLPLRWGFVRLADDGRWTFTTARDVSYPPLDTPLTNRKKAVQDDIELQHLLKPEATTKDTTVHPVSSASSIMTDRL